MGNEKTGRKSRIFAIFSLYIIENNIYKKTKEKEFGENSSVPSGIELRRYN